MACNELCFMAYEILHQAQLKEVDLIQKQETMTLKNLRTLGLV